MGMLEEISIIDTIKSDTIFTKHRAVFDVKDKDEYIIATIDITDKYISFTAGSEVKACAIPGIKKLLTEYNYDSNITTDADDICKTTSDDVNKQYEMRTADDVRQSFFFREGGREIANTDHEYNTIMKRFVKANFIITIVGDEQSNPVVLVTNYINPHKPERWLMILSEWNKL